MSRAPVLIDARNFEQGRTDGAQRRTRRAADAYAREGDYDAATREVFQTDPELAGRYREQGEFEQARARRTATEEYEREVAPMVAQGNYSQAIETAGERGRPVAEISALQTQYRAASAEQRAEFERQLQVQTRSLLGIAELPDPAQQQAAYTQWRASLPPEAQARVPEQFSQGYVRRRLREAMTIEQFLDEEHRTRQHGETVRHNQAMEANAVAGTPSTTGRRQQQTNGGTVLMNRIAGTENVLTHIARARQLARGNTGVGGLMRHLPATEARDLQGILDVIRANIGFDALQAMREASPTGGALGQVTERELALLQSVVSNLDQEQSTAQFLLNLQAVEDQYNRSMAAIRAAYEQDYGGPGSGQTTFSDIPQEAIQQLAASDTPEMRAQFDEVFGPGAAAAVLGQ